MISLILDNIDYSGKLIYDFSEEFIDILDDANCFLSLNATRHRHIITKKHSLNCTITNLTGTEKSALETSVSKPFIGVFKGVTRKYFCEKRDFSCWYSDKNNDLWEVNLQMEEC